MAVEFVHRHFCLKMKTEVLSIDRRKINREELAIAGEIIKKGGLVAFPTETVYGLGGDGLNPASSKAIYEAKGRPSDNPLIIHIADIEALSSIVKDIPDIAKTLADRFWPGPLTMILPKSDIVPYETTGGLDTVAVRMPRDEIALELIRQGGGYIAAPSANTSGRPSPTKASHVYEDLAGRIEMIIDGGEVGIGVESSIIDITGDKPTILRPGYITKEMLEEIVDSVEYDPALTCVTGDIKPKAPGMKYRHYAPKAKLTVVEGHPNSVREAMKKYIADNREKGVKTGIICDREDRNYFFESDYVICVGSVDDKEEVARRLYDALREFDKTDVDEIYSVSFGNEGLSVAIMNRLLKAAGQNVIRV